MSRLHLREHRSACLAWVEAQRAADWDHRSAQHETTAVSRSTGCGPYGTGVSAIRHSLLARRGTARTCDRPFVGQAEPSRAPLGNLRITLEHCLEAQGLTIVSISLRRLRQPHDDLGKAAPPDVHTTQSRERGTLLGLADGLEKRTLISAPFLAILVLYIFMM